MVAGIITTFLLGSISMSLSQVTNAKVVANQRLAAHQRADAALDSLRREIASVIRSDDLFWTRLLIQDNGFSSSLGRLDRDEILLFTTRFRPIHPVGFSGEGMEYESQFRIEDDELGPALWHRRDAVPDEYPRGGGTATPLVDGLVSLNIEAYDGQQWYEEWDSDVDGLPMAIRVTVAGSGHVPGDDAYSEHRPIAILRTVIPIDRVLPPIDPNQQDELPPAEVGEAAGAGGAGGTGDGPIEESGGDAGGAQGTGAGAGSSGTTGQNRNSGSQRDERPQGTRDSPRTTNRLGRQGGS